jgi:hypothetical protein
MDKDNINIILIGVIIYLLLKKNNNNMTTEQKLKYAEAIGRTPKAFEELDVIF